VSQRPILILKTGSTFPSLAKREGDFEDWIASGLEMPTDSVRISNAQSEETLPPRTEIAGIVVTGSHAMVTDSEPWLARAADWLGRQVSAGTPVLAICFGHQMLAQALGGTVGWQRGGREIGSISITKLPEAENDPLLRQFPEVFPAPCCHAQSVLSIPPGAVCLARSQADPHQAFRIGDRAWGVQFHPEFSESILRSYVDRHREELLERGDDPDRIIASITASPTRRILRMFSDLMAIS
jgi:GMP synthase (glutamine-hydrolysing)